MFYWKYAKNSNHWKRILNLKEPQQYFLTMAIFETIYAYFFYIPTKIFTFQFFQQHKEKLLSIEYVLKCYFDSSEENFSPMRHVFVIESNVDLVVLLHFFIQRETRDFIKCFVFRQHSPKLMDMTKMIKWFEEFSYTKN